MIVEINSGIQIPECKYEKQIQLLQAGALH